MNDLDIRNLILAVLCSTLILVVWQSYFAPPIIDPQQEQGSTQTPSTTQIPKNLSTDNIPLSQRSAEFQDREIILTDQSVRIPIVTERISGTISLKGGRIDDISLLNYKETIEENSDVIHLFKPKGTVDAWYYDTGWTAHENTTALPNDETLWATNSQKLTPNSPVVLTWENEDGLRFIRTISVDENFMFSIFDTIENTTQNAMIFYPWGRVTRQLPQNITGFYILHEGPVGILGEKLEEFDYKDIQKKKNITFDTANGWLGFTDKYWLGVTIPPEDMHINARFLHTLHQGINRYQADWIGSPHILESNNSITVSSSLFAGAKEVTLLDIYGEERNIPKFDRAIDFGWFYFLTRPLFYLISWINSMVQNFGISILILTVIVKALLFPLANKSYKSMSRMKDLQPKMTELREQYGNDKQKFNQEVMNLYKREKVNPAAGCLPILIQIPIFFALYKVLFVSIEMRHAPFFGWVQDLSAPDPTNLFTLFGLLNWNPPAFLMIGIWPIIMGFSMFLQQKMNPQPTDPAQARIFAILPILFTFMLASFPAGLVIYWSWSNILSIIQQYFIMRSARKARAKENTP